MLVNSGTETTPLWMQQSNTNAFGDKEFAINKDPSNTFDNQSSLPTPDQQTSVSWALEAYKSAITDVGGQFEELATALDGKTAFERTNQERILIDNILSSVMDEINLIEGNFASAVAQSNVAQKFEMPTVLNAVNGDIGPETTGTVLPWGVAGAYSKESNTILLSQDTPLDFLNDVAAEELGEAVAAFAENNGVVLQEGDVGNRIANVLTGKAVDGGRVYGDVVIDGKTETAQFAAKSTEELAAEWGVSVETATINLAYAHNTQGGPPFTAESVPVRYFDEVIKAYGTHITGQLTINELAHAMAVGVVTTGGPGFADEHGKKRVVTRVDEYRLPAYDESQYEELAIQWGTNEGNVDWSYKVAADILDFEGRDYLPRGYFDDPGWNRLQIVYDEADILDVNALARAISDGAIVPESFVGPGGNTRYRIASISLNEISSRTLTDAIWTFAEDTVSGGAERTQISAKMLDDATDYLMDREAFTGGDYDAFIEHFADMRNQGVQDRFSKNAVLSMFTTGAFKMNDSTGKDHVSFSSTISEHHKPHWYESVLGEHTIADINQLIGMISDVTGYAAHEVALIFGKAAEWTEETTVKAATMIGEFVHHAVSDSSAAKLISQIVEASIANNPGIDFETYLYVDDLVLRFRTEADPMAGMILLRALTMPKESVADFLNQAMATDALLNGSVSEEVGGMIVDGLQEAMVGLWEGDEPPDPSALEVAGAFAMQETLTNSLSAKNLDENSFAQYLGSRNGDARFDFAAEAVFDLQGLASVLGTTEGVMDNFQTRFIFTHPRSIEGGRYHSEFRIRFFDEVGVSYGNGEGGALDLSASAGMQNYHDIVIPVTFDNDWSNVDVGDVLFKATFNAIVEGDVTSGDTFAESIKQFHWLPGNMRPAATRTFAAWSARAPGWMGTVGSVLGDVGGALYGNGDIELGTGVGTSLTFNLNEMTNTEIGFAAALMIAPTVVGAYFGFADGGGVYGAHWGADIGNLIGTGFAYGYEMAENPEAVAVSFEYFGWGALRPNRANVSDGNIALRARYQHNEGISATYNHADDDWDFGDLG